MELRKEWKTSNRNVLKTVQYLEVGHYSFWASSYQLSFKCIQIKDQYPCHKRCSASYSPPPAPKIWTFWTSDMFDELIMNHFLCLHGGIDS